MRTCFLICASAALLSCSSDESALNAEARSELSTRYVEASVDTLKVRNVRRVSDAVCGEVSIEPKEKPPVFRLFYYRPGKDAALDLAPGLPLTADGTQCPIRDHILAICAPTAPEREQAELRMTQCQLSRPF
jgi:hypothetical protein